MPLKRPDPTTPQVRATGRQRRGPAALAGLLAGLTLAAVSGGCGNEDPWGPVPQGSVTLRFDHRVGAVALELETGAYLNAADNPYRVQHLRYYVSNLELVRGDGSAVWVGGVHYRDAAIESSRDWVSGAIPDGHYTAVRFMLGLDAAHNVSGMLPPSFASVIMAWPEQLGGGYHFMQLDGLFTDSGGLQSGWAAHLGRLVTDKQPVPVETAFQVELPHVVHVAGNAVTVPVVMDVNAWFASPHVYDFDVIGGFNMDNPDALMALHDNGAHVFEIGTSSLASAAR